MRCLFLFFENFISGSCIPTSQFAITDHCLTVLPMELGQSTFKTKHRPRAVALISQSPATPPFRESHTSDVEKTQNEMGYRRSAQHVPCSVAKTLSNGGAFPCLLG